ncbi:bidirectional sugar transporter sweet11-like protein [Trifolium pratense]|uniref:Bidirectional sugar transporter sweet11-like protein n=1 Tax=Trifolium pratense TaxID=57577 RepID=A0A2K3LDJ2_TRIPR|nr:bidirectional sugar transporter sweet11-like protein [Trifolium pratense]
MPHALTICLIVSVTVWFFYAILPGDMNINLLNVIGLALGTIQVLLYNYYSRTGRKTDVERTVVQEDLRGGGENLIGSVPVIEQ